MKLLLLQWNQYEDALLCSQFLFLQWKQQHEELLLQINTVTEQLSLANSYNDYITNIVPKQQRVQRLKHLYDLWSSSACLNCSSCPPGEYRMGCGEFSPGTCVPYPTCPAGYTLRGYSSTSSGSCVRDEYVCPIPCPVNSISDRSLSYCWSCPLGTYTNGVGSTVCTACPVGKSADMVYSGCTACAPGSYAELTGVTQCKQCPSGKYNDQWGSSACSDCPVPSRACSAISGHVGGYYCATSGACGSSTSNGVYLPCSTCSAGSVLIGCGGGSAGACAPSVGSCTYLCPANTFSPPGSSVCADCSYGQYSDVGSDGCKTCPPGTASNSSGVAGCPLCGPGTFSNTTGSPYCQQCPSGKYNNQSAMTYCLDCPVYRQSRVNTSVIQGCACQAGFYDVQGECVPCAEGFYCSLSSN
eukprot:763443-Hanusia_phi.AAC.1